VFKYLEGTISSKLTCPFYYFISFSSPYILGSMYSLASSILETVHTRLGQWPLSLLSQDNNSNKNKSKLAYGLLGNRNCSSALWAGKFEIDSRTGFVPWSPPVTSLPLAFARWEHALATAPNQVSLANLDLPKSRISSQTWRESLAKVSNLKPVLDNHQ